MNPFLIILFAYFAPTSAKTHDISEVSFLLGCWKKDGSGQERGEVETWTKISNTKLEGKAKTFQNGTVVFWENLEIFINTEGITYQPSPMGKKSVAFTYENRGNGKNLKKAAFINMKHDFPQQIIYELDTQTPNQLNVQLYGMENQKQKHLNYVMNRSQCEDAAKK